MVLRELFARTTEDLLVLTNTGKQCRKKLDPDVFDGRSYAIADFYHESSRYFERPSEFFCGSAGSEGLHLSPCDNGLAHRLRGLARLYLFDSPFVTNYPENNLVPFKWFRSWPEQRSTILLFAPGWGRCDQGFEEEMCTRLAHHGIDAGLLTKPFHQQRTPAGARSGEYFISPNLFWTIANFRQFTVEIRLLLRYMRGLYKYVGLIGLSSGGFQAGLASDCEEVDFLFPVMTGCLVGSVTWNGLLTRPIRRTL